MLNRIDCVWPVLWRIFFFPIIDKKSFSCDLFRFCFSLKLKNSPTLRRLETELQIEKSRFCKMSSKKRFLQIHSNKEMYTFEVYTASIHCKFRNFSQRPKRLECVQQNVTKKFCYRTRVCIQTTRTSRGSNTRAVRIVHATGLSTYWRFSWVKKNKFLKFSGKKKLQKRNWKSKS